EEALSESAEMTEGDFSYVIVNNSYARITRYSGSATIVQVPSTIGGYAVQVIGARAFQGNTVLESMELPDGLTTIYAYAFADCTNLTQINLSEGLNIRLCI
ncbi:MAG: leucine-rich repeat protein, partial [Blautia faecis]